MIKKILILLLIVNLNGCGFTPVYKFNENVDFKISNIDFEGDRLVNNFLRSNFARYLSIESDNEFEVKINTSFEKEEVSRDKKGDLDLYKIRVKAIITVTQVKQNDAVHFNKITRVYSFSEEFLQKNITTNKYEEKNYANSIVQNLTDTIFDKFILAMAYK